MSRETEYTKREAWLLAKLSKLFGANWRVEPVEHGGGFNVRIELRGKAGGYDDRLSVLICRRRAEDVLTAARRMRARGGFKVRP